MGCLAALQRPDGFVDLFKLRTGAAWVPIFQLGRWQESPGDGGEIFFLACTFFFGGKRRHLQKGSELVTSALLMQQLRLGSGRAHQFGLGNYESEDVSSLLFSERRPHISTV